MLPGATFGLHADELIELQKRIADDHAPPVSDDTLGEDGESEGGDEFGVEDGPDTAGFGHADESALDEPDELRDAA